MLHQYVYVSTAPNLGSDELESILDSCRRNNMDRNVTGLLLYNGRNFLQLLEGASTDIVWVMRRVGSDPRHSGVSALEDMPAKERSCPDWTMRHIRLVDDVSKRREALDAELPDNLDPHLRRIMLNFAALN